MTVILPQYKFAYLAVPKVACTTIKTKLFQIENDTNLEGLIVNGRPMPIHRLYPTQDFSHINHARISGFRRFAVVRDPIVRFLSAYRNRVLEKDEISHSRHCAALAARGLPLQPDLSTFIAHLEDYSVVRGISHHVSPMTTFLGRDPSYFERIFDIGETDQFFQLIGSITGRHIRTSHHNVSSKGAGAEPTAAEERRLRRFYEEDYDIYGRFIVR